MNRLFALLLFVGALMLPVRALAAGDPVTWVKPDGLTVCGTIAPGEWCTVTLVLDQESAVLDASQCGSPLISQNAAGTLDATIHECESPFACVAPSSAVGSAISDVPQSYPVSHLRLDNTTGFGTAKAVCKEASASGTGGVAGGITYVQASDPGACTSGETWIDTDASPEELLHICSGGTFALVDTFVTDLDQVAGAADDDDTVPNHALLLDDGTINPISGTVGVPDAGGTATDRGDGRVLYSETDAEQTYVSRPGSASSADEWNVLDANFTHCEEWLTQNLNDAASSTRDVATRATGLSTVDSYNTGSWANWQRGIPLGGLAEVWPVRVLWLGALVPTEILSSHVDTASNWDTVEGCAVRLRCFQPGGALGAGTLMHTFDFGSAALDTMGESEAVWGDALDGSPLCTGHLYLTYEAPVSSTGDYCPDNAACACGIPMAASSFVRACYRQEF